MECGDKNQDILSNWSWNKDLFPNVKMLSVKANEVQDFRSKAQTGEARELSIGMSFIKGFSWGYYSNESETSFYL